MMYYRVALQVGSSATWQWRSTVLTSLEALFGFLRLYGCVPKERIRVFFSSSTAGLDAMLRRENEGLVSNSVRAVQFLNGGRRNAASLVRTLYDLYNAHQSDSAWLDKCLAVISEDCEVINVPLGMTVRGPEGYKQLMLGWTEAFPESGNKKTNVVATEDGAVAEYIGHGIHTGPMHSPAGEILATGRKVELPFCDVYRVRNGKVVSLHQYYDGLGFMQQLGLVPPMG